MKQTITELRANKPWEKSSREAISLPKLEIEIQRGTKYKYYSPEEYAAYVRDWDPRCGGIAPEENLIVYAWERGLKEIKESGFESFLLPEHILKMRALIRKKPSVNQDLQAILEGIEEQEKDMEKERSSFKEHQVYAGIATSLRAKYDETQNTITFYKGEAPCSEKIEVERPAGFKLGKMTSIKVFDKKVVNFLGGQDLEINIPSNRMAFFGMRGNLLIPVEERNSSIYGRGPYIMPLGIRKLPRESTKDNPGFDYAI